MRHETVQLNTTKKPSWLLAALLKTLFKMYLPIWNPATNSQHIKHVSFNNNSQLYPGSFDLAAMYTSIPAQDAIINVVEKLCETRIDTFLAIADIYRTFTRTRAG